MSRTASGAVNEQRSAARMSRRRGRASGLACRTSGAGSLARMRRVEPLASWMVSAGAQSGSPGNQAQPVRPPSAAVTKPSTWPMTDASSGLPSRWRPFRQTELCLASRQAFGRWKSACCRSPSRRGSSRPTAQRLPVEQDHDPVHVGGRIEQGDAQPAVRRQCAPACATTRQRDRVMQMDVDGAA